MTTTQPTIEEQLTAYRMKVWKPGMPKAEMDRLVQAEHDRLIRTHPGVVKLQAKAEAAKKERADEEQRKHDAVEQHLADRAAEREQTDRSMARSDWIQSGGHPAEFEQAWPAMHQQMLTDRTMASMQRGQAAVRDQVRRAL